MLAIITKMTLTQVSTWFANARRRLKKENKMTWSPRNRSEDGTEDNDNDDDDLDDGKDPLSDNERLCDDKDDSSKPLHEGGDFKGNIRAFNNYFFAAKYRCVGKLNARPSISIQLEKILNRVSCPDRDFVKIEKTSPHI